MSAIKNKKRILSVIDQIRSQKARPDEERICKFMQKCYKVSQKETKEDLERCLLEKSIYKVDYKDNVSYRNAANTRKNRKICFNNKTMDSSSAERRVITTAIASLIYQDQSYLENGIAFEDLVKAAAAQDSKYSKKQLEAIIQKELSSGSLIRLPNKNLALGPADNDENSSDSVKFEYNTDSNTKISSANSSCRSSPQQRVRGRPRKRGGASGPSSSASTKGVRVGERRKMAKKVFDPSDVSQPSKRKRGRPTGSLNKSTKKKDNSQYKEEEDSQQSDPSEEMDAEETAELSENETSGGVCSVCILPQLQGSNDKLIKCTDCSSKAHLSCLQSGSGILKLRPDNTWQCPHCKSCKCCCETNDAGVLTVCSTCSDAYHALCHSPRIPERLKAWDQWKCKNCIESKPTVSEPTVSEPTVSEPTVSEPTVSDSPNNPLDEPFLKPHEIEREEMKLDHVAVDESIPDITDWSSEDVYNYFIKEFPEAAPILKAQNMDGQALAMATRADIVRGLGLPLGPALALYCIIVKLQTRKDDWTVCWG